MLGTDTITTHAWKSLSSWTDIITNFFMTRIIQFPRTSMPSKLNNPNQHLMELEFEPYSKTWELFVDTSDTTFLTKKIRPTEMMSWKTNGIYNKHNNFGLSIPFISFLNI